MKWAKHMPHPSSAFLVSVTIPRTNGFIHCTLQWFFFWFIKTIITWLHSNFSDMQTGVLVHKAESQWCRAGQSTLCLQETHGQWGSSRALHRKSLPHRYPQYGLPHVNIKCYIWTHMCTYICTQISINMKDVSISLSKCLCEWSGRQRDRGTCSFHPTYVLLASFIWDLICILLHILNGKKWETGVFSFKTG